MEDARKKLEEAERARDLAIATDKDPTPYIEPIHLARRALKKLEEEDRKKPKPHPHLQIGPITQTIAIMAAITMVMSNIELPYEMIDFYILFRGMTIIAVLAHVGYSTVIWYGYKKALGHLPQLDKPKNKIHEMLKKDKRPERPDPWSNPKAHPSQFLTTRNAPPRLFPFPLGKTKPDAAVKDELWWEGGNAPHVGHFNRFKLDEPGGVDPNRTEEIVLQKVMKQMEIEDQEKLWKKRIRGVQILCVVIILNFLYQKVAIVALIWLIYTTLSTELDNMLKPSTSIDADTWKLIDGYVKGSSNQKFRPKMQLESAMTYIYDQDSVDSKPAAMIPISSETPHVLMTSDDPWLVGPGA